MSLQGLYIVESGFSNAILWITHITSKPWIFQFLFNDIKVLSSTLQVHFTHVISSANSMEGTLAKQRVDRVSPYFASI